MKKLFLLLSASLSISSGFSHRPFHPIQVKDTLRISSHSPALPILKYLSTNPVIRLAVSLPGGAGNIDLRTLRCTLNAAALPNIAKIDLYLTGAEPFSSKQLLGSVQPTRSAFDMPFQLRVKPGIVFLWMSIVLKQDAGIQQDIELHCLSVTDESGAACPVEQGTDNYKKRVGVAIRKADQENVHTYRIPGLIRTKKGTLISVYDIRYKSSTDLPGNIDVGMSRSTDGGATWEPMQVIMDMGPPHDQNGIGDPAVLYDHHTDKIWVAALWSKGNRSIAGSLPGLSPDSTGQFVLVQSGDDGLSWSVPYTITPQVKDPAWHLFFQGPGNGIVMQDGTLVFAAQYWDEKKIPYSTIIYSEDQGSTWKGKIPGPKANTTESQVVETLPGTLMLNMRDNRGGYRSVAVTQNAGVSWTEHATSFNALIDPVCMGSIIKGVFNVKGERREVVLFSNPNTSSGRFAMTVKASLDWGATWPASNQLLYDERMCYGYSCLSQYDEEHVAVLYEGVRELYFLVIPINQIIR